MATIRMSSDVYLVHKVEPSFSIGNGTNVKINYSYPYSILSLFFAFLLRRLELDSVFPFPYCFNQHRRHTV